MTKVPAAAIFPHSHPSYCMKLTIATGAVIALVRVRIRAKKKSFHERMKQRIVVAAKPGTESGKVIFRKACQMPHPSVHAASSRDCGTPSKKAVIVQMTSGRLKVR